MSLFQPRAQRLERSALSAFESAVSDLQEAARLHTEAAAAAGDRRKMHVAEAALAGREQVALEEAAEAARRRADRLSSLID